jgi:hypothetical protein
MNPVVEDKREDTVQDLMESNRDEIEVEEPELKNIPEEVQPEEETVETEPIMEHPQYELKNISAESDLTFPKYRKNAPTAPSPSQRSPISSSMFSLSNPMVKYGLIVFGVIAIIGIFLGTKKSSSTGPVIVDVTENADGEKKSVRNSVNRVSSPRIVFGDLRKNPSLMVAPPMTPNMGK